MTEARATSQVQPWFVLLFEKVASTFGEAFLTVLLASTWQDITVVRMATISGVMAIGTLILNALTTSVIPVGLPFWTDLALRVLRTYGVSVLTIFTLLPVEDVSLDGKFLWSILLSGVPAAMAAAKGVFAKRIGKEDTPALVPADKDVQVVPSGPFPPAHS